MKIEDLMQLASSILRLAPRVGLYDYAYNDMKNMLARYGVRKVSHLDERDFANAYAEMCKMLETLESLQK